MIKGVILDIDGTILRSNEAHAEAWLDALNDFGWGVPLPRLRWLIGMSGTPMLHVLYPQMSSDQGIGKVISTRRLHIFLTRYAPHLDPTPGARALVAHMLDAGLKVVIGTSAKQAELKVLLDRAGVADLLTESVSSSDVEEGKPAPDVVEAALHKLEMRPEDVIMIGDTPYDIESASRAGVRTVAVRCSGWTDVDLRGAAAIYENPADILAHYNQSPLGKEAS